jgi:hypothetical protein
LPTVRTANSTPQRRAISIPTAARLHSANGRPSASGVWRQISSCTSASCAGFSKRCSSGLRPRGLLTSPFAPSAAKRWQISSTPVRLSPTSAAIAL